MLSPCSQNLSHSFSRRLLLLRGITFIVTAVCLSGCGFVSPVLQATAQTVASPSSITWGGVAVGQAGGPKVATLTNNGTSSISISGMSFTGADPSDFAIYKQTCGSTLASSSSCTVTVLFKPTTTGTRTATLTFTDTDSSSPQQVSLSGTGAGAVVASPGSLNLGSAAVGSSATPQSITVSNTTSSSVTLSAAAVSGANSSDFTISSNNCGSTLAASASCTAGITFKPSASGSRAASWSITSSSSATPLTVTLTGTGTTAAGLVAASPTSLVWNTVAVGQTSGSKVVTLTNNGTSSISINSIGFAGADPSDFISNQKTCGSTLAASSSCTVTVLFRPTTSGTRTATLTFTDTDSSSPQQVSLSGTGTGGTGSVSASPGSLSFGSVAVNSSSSPQSITVSNTTASSVTLGAAAISGTNSSDFTISSNNCGSTLAASASCTAGITFKPSASGSRTASWSITSSNSASPLTATLTGTGTTAAGGTVTISPSSLTWGKVAFGQTSGGKVVTISNTGTTAVSFNGVTVGGTNSGDFSVSANTCGSSIAASSSCTVTAYFAPRDTGSLTATLSFSDGAGNSPQTIPLAGTATPASSDVSTSPTRLSFPQTNIGTPSSALTAALLNGSTASITLNGLSLSGTDATDYSIASTTCGSSLAPSTSCTANLVFTPSASGTRTAVLSFSDSASNSPQDVSLTGTGLNTNAGTATVSPTSLSFPTTAVGASSQSLRVYLKNTSSAAIGISSISIAGGNSTDFTITANTCGTQLAASATCNETLVFAPTAPGARSSTLSFTDGASNSPQNVPLSGTGTPASTTTITISPSSISWGTQNVGTAATAQTFTISAGGSGTANFSGFSFTSTDPSDFSITANTCGASLAAGSSCTVSVNFQPTAIGNRVALFTVTDDAIASPQTAEVSGGGAYSTPQTASVTVDFGSRSGSQVAIPAGILGTEYLESLPTNANRTTVVQAGFTAARYKLLLSSIYTSTTPNWNALNSDMQKFMAAGVHPEVILVDTPTFLQPSPLLSSCKSDPPTSVPTSFTQWGQLAASVVAHLDSSFPGLVQEYEIWNEPNTTALCSTNRLADYTSIYAATAPLLESQAKTDGVTIKIGGPATAGVGFTGILTNTSTAQYVDFYSYHIYEGNSTDIKNGMTWDGAGGTPSLFAKVMNSSSGIQARYLQAYAAVKGAKTPLGAKTPIYFDEYNDDWAFLHDCCRNDPTYSPLFNSITVAQLLNSVYQGAGEVPARMIYFSAAQQTFCILGVIDPAMDCTKAATGAQAQPYPQWYTYEMIFAPAFLDLQNGGFMASSVTLSRSASSAGLIATGYYTTTTNSVLIINPTASSFSGLTLQINNPGVTSPKATLYTINAANPQVSVWPATTITSSGGLQATFDLPSYSVLAVSLK